MNDKYRIRCFIKDKVTVEKSEFSMYKQIKNSIQLLNGIFCTFLIIWNAKVHFKFEHSITNELYTKNTNSPCSNKPFLFI